MNELMNFTFDGAQIRIVQIDGEPWFVGKDVAERLGYKDAPDALKKHVDEDDKRIVKNGDLPPLENHFPESVFPLNLVRADIPNRGLTAINESGVYALIFGSKLPAAKRFKRWVTNEVLPAIRKNGGYAKPAITKPDSYMIDDREQRALRWIEETQEWQDKVSGLQTQIDAQAPKVALAEAIVENPECIHIGDLAKILRQNGIDTGKTRLFKWLRENEWLCSSSHERNFPTQKAIDKGYMILKEHVLHFNGEEEKRFTPMITGAGQEFFINWFLSNEKVGKKPHIAAAERQAAAKKPAPPRRDEDKIRTGQRIRSILEEQHATQTELATAIGVSRQTINSIVRGETGATPHRLAMIACFLGVPVEQLIG